MSDDSKRVHELDPETVKKMAVLARLELTDEQVREFSGQMSTIIEYFNQLGEVDVESVPPANLVGVREDVLREDQVAESLASEEFLEGVPERHADQVSIPPVFGSGSSSES